ncbi:hypothetical protein [Corallococcus llansteffanensis]|uniref:Uncharacterized protein n=1 Tax=Corallococcus llansteffanensis TaxID=2316731 RepID=A0A3A8QLI5_9BACT|nr:hypothetical protein [Corallococcus llansteffanensis]RKH67810.1 hypothetical protein D7V93_02360 [Corallococcus llansteffanensis]
MVKITRSPAPKLSQVSKVDVPVTKAPAVATPSRAPSSASSMAAPVAAGTKAPAQQKVEQQVAALAEGPTRQALLQMLSGALPAPVVGLATQAIAGFSPAQQKELSTLLSKAGVSAKASPRADAGAERAFLFKAIASGAQGATLKRLAEQIRGRPPTNQAFSFNPMSAMASKRAAPASPAEAAAAKLKAAMDDIWGTDEAAVHAALEGVDPALLTQVAERYEKLTSTPLREALNLELEGPDLQRALAALGRAVSAAPTAPVQAPVKAAKAAAVASTPAPDIQKNLDALQVSSRDEGVIKRGNAVELNDIIPINVAQWDPPKAHIYAPLKKAVEARNKAQEALAKATTEPAKKAAQAKIDAADQQITSQGEKLKAWMKEHLATNPSLMKANEAVKLAGAQVAALEKKHAKAKVPTDAKAAETLKQSQKDELDAARAKLTQAQTHQQTVKDGLLTRIAGYTPMVDVQQTRTDVTVDGTTVRMRDGRETAYTNSWKAVDGGATSGDAAANVDTQLEKSGISEDRQKILASISGLEGTFSKVNTWDTGRVSWGFAQWTLGKSGNGTLAEFMRDLKKTDPAQYEKSFGKYGIDIDAKGVVLTRGDGTVLRGVDAAEEIRTDVKLSAVFMAAGADPAMQQAQVRFASAGKISGARNRSVSVVGKDAEGQPVKAKLQLKDVITSEYANAILSDLEVNAGSGGRVAEAALKKYVKDKGVDPAKVEEWGPDAQKVVLAALEHASRSERLTHHGKAGFSKEPDTFVD